MIVSGVDAGCTPYILFFIYPKIKLSTTQDAEIQVFC